MISQSVTFLLPQALPQPVESVPNEMVVRRRHKGEEKRTGSQPVAVLLPKAPAAPADTFPARFVVRLEKRAGRRLGLHTYTSESKSSLLVGRVADRSIVASWNRRNPDQQVGPNCLIESVNGISGSAEDMYT